MNLNLRAFFMVALLILFVTLSGCGGGGQTVQPPPPFSWPAITGFMTVSGSGFQDGFQFMGANLDPWRFITASGEVYSQAEIGNWVANAVLYTHAHVIRMHMNGGAFEPSIGSYGESSFKQLDYLLAAAAENNVYVLICLRDYLWSPWPSSAYDPYWLLGGGSVSHPNKDAILTDAAAKTAFKNYITYVLNRVNTVTGVKYKDDPHIFGWEIINEPNTIPGLKDWLVEMGDTIKSVDANHLVGTATGDLSGGDWTSGSANWDALNISQLDFVDLHYYADYYNPGNTDWVTRFNQDLQAAAALHKPIIIGEFGYPNNDLVSKILNFYQSIISASFAHDASGVMPYSWGPPGPNQFGAAGSFCMYTNDAEVCSLLRSLAP